MNLGVDATVYAKKVWSLKSDFRYYVRQKTPQFQDNLSNQLWNARVQRTFKNNEFTVYFSCKRYFEPKHQYRKEFLQ